LGQVRKDRALLWGSLVKLIESFTLYISFAGLINPFSYVTQYRCKTLLSTGKEIS